MCRMWTALLAAQLSMMRMPAGPAMPCLGPSCKGPSHLHHLQILKPHQAQVNVCECDLGPACMLVAIANKQCRKPMQHMHAVSGPALQLPLSFPTAGYTARACQDKVYS